jgi:hypothetical protein
MRVRAKADCWRRPACRFFFVAQTLWGRERIMERMAVYPRGIPILIFNDNAILDENIVFAVVEMVTRTPAEHRHLSRRDKHEPSLPYTFKRDKQRHQGEYGATQACNWHMTLLGGQDALFGRLWSTPLRAGLGTSGTSHVRRTTITSIASHPCAMLNLFLRVLAVSTRPKQPQWTVDKPLTPSKAKVVQFVLVKKAQKDAAREATRPPHPSPSL